MKAKQKRAILFVILGGVLLCAGAVLAFALGLPTGEAPYPDHIIDGVSPNGTTINLFDYWITTQGDADNVDPANLLTSGINDGHALLFGASLGSKGYGDWNEWTGTETPQAGIVKSGLTDGYPQLAIDTRKAENVTIKGRNGSESLAYLFDPAVAVDGKASYRDAQGLLQVDKDGYYYFNSAENYAVYYPGDNAFTLYEYPGVRSGGAAGNVGQFFPFNEATANPTQQWHNPLMNTVDSIDASLNHYFGIHMSTRFVQQNGGYVDKNQTKAVTYEFSGDDDVWIFIDGVLVADLGGIHNAASVKINFSTGIIEINGTEQGQKLGALLGVGSNTLPDDTYHTLDFFYLERGNTDSNLSLKYNLVSIPESAVIKVDENGNTLAGAEFALTVSYTENGALVTETLTSGTTGADGRLVLRESEVPDALPLTIDQLYELYERYGQKKNLSLTLTETSTPDGYRSAGAVSLRFDKVGEQHILLAANPWSTGAYATSGVLLKLGNSIGLYSTDGGIMGEEPVDTIDLSSTTPRKMFGVIFMKDAAGDWRPIHGNPIDGWTVEDGSGWQNIQAALTKNPCWFQLGSGGAWEITIDELPGDINKYYNALPEDELDSAQYGVFYYYTVADAVEDIKGNNTWLMNTFAENSGVQRQFFANLYVPNLRNELSVLKVGEQDQPLEGATFALYAASDVTVTGGSYTAAGTARLTGVTGANGRLVFGDDELLPQGNYYLIETSAPTGYLKNGTPIPVVVDDAGVHVDAGTADNGVSVRFEAGNLVGSMWAFATDDKIDVTLHHITAKFYTTPSDAVEFDADTTFVDQAWRGIVGTGTVGAAFQAIDGVTYHPSYYAVSDDAGGYTIYRYDAENVPEGASPLGMHLKYAGNGQYGAYAGLEQQGDPVTFMETDTGWGHLMMEQCSYHTLESGKEYTKLHGTELTDLTNLFADSVTVKVANEPVDDAGPEPSYIVVQKSIAGLNDTQIEQLKRSLAITVTGNGEAGPVSYTLAYGREDGATILWREVNKTLWSWRINGVSGDTYTVTETGCDPEDLSLPEGTKLTATGLGTTTIGVADIGLEIEEDTTCSHKNWPLYDGCFFAGTLTGNRGTVVITSRAPSASQRKAIEDALLGGVWKETVYYYSLNSLQIDPANQDPAYNIAMNISGDDGLITTLHYYPNAAYEDGGTPGQIVFSNTSVWQHVAKIVYDTEAAQVGDIQISNTYTQLVDLAVEKVWNDADDQDGKRPETVTVRLLADGLNTGKTLTLNAGNGWSDSFTGLDVYSEGVAIVYTVEEVNVAGYQSSITGSAADGFTITNTHTPEKTAVSVEKVWNDADDQDGKRPETVTVRLLADGLNTGKTLTLNAGNGWSDSFTGLDVYSEGVAIVYTVEEVNVAGYQSSITGSAADGFTITNTHTPEKTAVSVQKVWDDADDQDGMRPDAVTVRLLADGESTDRALTLNADNGWSGSFTDLDVYNAGQPIAYTVEEVNVAGYQSSITGSAADGFTITNTHTPEKTAVSVQKVWDDADDQDGMRPDAVTVRLLADGESTDRALTLNADNGWSGSFTDLDVYNAGQPIAYTVEEVNVAGYQSSITGSAADGFTITNTHTPETTAVSVEKVWDDADDQDGMRPDEITVRLLADGQKTDRALTLNADNDWAGSFSDLAVYNAGQPIAYTVEEEAVTGYQPSITGDAATGFTITNTHTPETTAVSVEKVWDDADDQDGMRPKEITIRLLANGEEVAGKTLTLNAANDWAGSFSGLDVYSEGVAIVYTVEEADVAGYQPQITGSAATGFTITNTHTPETITVSGSKTWNEADGRDDRRPDAITIRLLANGEEVAGKARTVTAADGWAWEFADLPKYENGQEIVYTIAEDAVPGYTATVDGFNVTNTKDILSGSLTVSKTVSGNAGDTEREWAFTVWLDDTSINGTYGDMTFVGGMATFLLRHGESATATGLPAGVSYRVTETGANQDGYNTTKQGDTGVIPEGGTATATFDNAKTIAPPPATGSLAVSKTVSGSAGDTERAWTFTVRLGDTGINGAYGDMTFVDGVATFRLRHGESVKASGLPAGVAYVVTEAEANQDGYATAATGDTGTISGGRTARAGFTNTRETPQVPAAGDEASPLLWFLLGFACLLGLGGAAMLDRRMRGGTKS